MRQADKYVHMPQWIWGFDRRQMSPNETQGSRMHIQYTYILSVPYKVLITCWHIIRVHGGARHRCPLGRKHAARRHGKHITDTENAHNDVEGDVERVVQIYLGESMGTK